MHQINDRAFQVSNRAQNTFTLQGVNGNSYNAGDGGYVLKCLVANCKAVVTSPGHGYAEGNALYFENARGITDFNNKLLPISSVTADSFVLDEPFNRSNTHVANTGRFFCTWQTATEGCPYYRFRNVQNTWLMNPVTTCVTERESNAFNDQPPNVSYVGRNYPDPGNGCLPSSIVPLTTDEATLDDAIEDFVATGSTSGSLGILWSWYMLAPNFGYVWPEDSRPAPYETERLLKAAIIMTDGEFNTVHHDGVVAKNSTSGSSVRWGNADYINEDAHNGIAYEQARRYCDEMKNRGIVVYTVGYGLAAGTPAANVMSYCASDPDKAYLAEDGEDLRNSFDQIARNISSLRLTL